YLAERLRDLMALAVTPEREDATTGGTDRCVPPVPDDGLEIDDPAPMAGTLPAPVPDNVWLRSGAPAGAQPPASIARVSGIATFVWIGDDPLVANPRVTLEHETGTDIWEAVTRRSGRTVADGEILVAYTPDPLRRVAGEAQTHYWTAEWQAVPWIGCQDDALGPCDDLDGFAGVPLGNYRFHVVGKAFDITSDPFAVTAADLQVTPSLDGSFIDIAVELDAPRGYRFLDAQLPSNQPVPVRAGSFDVVMSRNAGGDLTFNGQTIGADGILRIDAGGEAGNVTGVTVTDHWGNSKTASL
ncbi:MAG TPA: hypothetical protein VL172_03395, partial [Kofleriaceae bacterium]|nr:hypothetical protein [Kofleriaceae bacterium]